MRVLIVSEDIPQPHLGGLGKHALALADELARRGHAVDVLGNAVHAIADHPEQRGPGRFFAAIDGHQRGWGQARLGLFHPLALALRARALARAIRQHAPGYDVIHYHGHLPWVAAQLPDGLPFTQTRHDQGGDCMLNTRFLPAGRRCESRDPADCAGCAAKRPGPLQRRLSTWTVRGMRRRTSQAYARHPVIFVSGFLREAFARVSTSGPRGEVIHNAIDAGALRAVLRALPPVGDRAARVELFGAGAFNRYKGFGSLLDELSRQGGLPAGWRLTLAGDGPELPALRERHAGPSVRFLGWCAYPTVLAHTACADAVVVPSELDEACATTVIEALALGRTVYALRRGGTPELAAHAAGGSARLHLFDTLADLVARLLVQAPRAVPAAHDVPAGFGASIAAMTDRVLLHYARHFGAPPALP